MTTLPIIERLRSISDEQIRETLTYIQLADEYMREAAFTIETMYEALEYVWSHVELEGEVARIVSAARKKARGQA